ncbi:MAG: rod shape-determining protein RodA [Lachnospiraceae bacterium]|nr:rod shape-determining protein RodA [Lachnospiraceae bacterium]
MFKKYRLRDFDFRLVILVLLASGISVMAVGSANESYVKTQIIGIAAGFVAMLVIALFDYAWILKFYWVMYVGILGLLILTAYSPLGETSGGAQRWIDLGPIRFQPSELAKIVLILFFAQFIMRNRKTLNKLTTLMVSCVLFGIPAYLIWDQPDLSTTLVIVTIFCTLLFVGGLSWRYILTVVGIAVPVLCVFVFLAIQPEANLLEDHQKERILAFIDPEEYADSTAYQQNNSVIAIASGQLLGKGYKNNEVTSVKNGRYILEPHTDFIFAVIGEELGFRGSVFLIAVLFSIVLECLYVAYKAKDTAGRLIASGVAAWIGFQTFFNLGVTTFILPNTGLPLPFISYGLTSVMCLYMAIGFVLNIKLQQRKNGEVFL